MKTAHWIIIGMLICLVAVGGKTFSQQKSGFVNSQTILNELPEAQEAQKKLNAIVQAVQDTLEKMQKDFQAKYEDYQKKQAMMTDAAKKEEEQKLVEQDQQIKQYQQVKFSQTGEIAQQREKVFAPVREKIVKAIQSVAKEEKMVFVFDKTPDGSMVLYAEPTLDLTYKVLDRMKRGK
ncbi:MAG: OmpH family outer membrane protein [Bacteroidota bacterium]